MKVLCSIDTKGEYSAKYVLVGEFSPMIDSTSMECEVEMFYLNHWAVVPFCWGEVRPLRSLSALL